MFDDFLAELVTFSELFPHDVNDIFGMGIILGKYQCFMALLF